MKKLVVYFSASGVTRKEAKCFASDISASLYEIVPREPYTAADLDWTDKNSRSSREMKDEAARPEIASADPDISSFDNVHIGFPIWWGIAPRIINTYIERNNLRGKRVVIFATSGGSPIANAIRNLQEKYPELSIEAGKLLNNH